MDDLFKIIAIDPGSQTLGIAIYTISSSNKAIIDIKTSTLYLENLPMNNLFNNSFSRDDKLVSLYNFMLNLFNSERPSAIALEAPFFNRFSPKAYGVLTEVVAYIKMAAFNYSTLIDLINVEPLLVKKSIGSNYREGKDGVRDAVIRNNVLKPFLSNSITEHEYDAIAIGWHLYNSLC